MVLTLDPLQTFYLVGAMVLLAVAILVYPSLKNRTDKSKK